MPTAIDKLDADAQLDLLVRFNHIWATGTFPDSILRLHGELVSESIKQLTFPVEFRRVQLDLLVAIRKDFHVRSHGAPPKLATGTSVAERKRVRGFVDEEMVGKRRKVAVDGYSQDVKDWLKEIFIAGGAVVGTGALFYLNNTGLLESLFTSVVPYLSESKIANVAMSAALTKYPVNTKAGLLLRAVYLTTTLTSMIYLSNAGVAASKAAEVFIQKYQNMGLGERLLKATLDGLVRTLSGGTVTHASVADMMNKSVETTGLLPAELAESIATSLSATSSFLSKHDFTENKDFTNVAASLTNIKEYVSMAASGFNNLQEYTPAAVAHALTGASVMYVDMTANMVVPIFASMGVPNVVGGARNLYQRIFGSNSIDGTEQLQADILAKKSATESSTWKQYASSFFKKYAVPAITGAAGAYIAGNMTKEAARVAADAVLGKNIEDDSLASRLSKAVGFSQDTRRRTKVKKRVKREPNAYQQYVGEELQKLKALHPGSGVEHHRMLFSMAAAAASRRARADKE